MATLTKAKAIQAWHFLPEDGMLNFSDNVPVLPGGTYSAGGRLALCVNGMHGAERALDALKYAPGPVVCRVLLYGTYIRGDDKLCARNRYVLWKADATNVLHQFAIWCAGQALQSDSAAGYEPVPVLLEALETKRRWLAGDCTAWELDAAESDARIAAQLITETRGIRRARQSSAYTVVWAAARVDVVGSTRAAALSALSTATADESWIYPGNRKWSAALAAQQTQLETMLMALAPGAGSISTL